LDGAVLRLTLDRPEVRNAFNDELIARLTEAVASAPTEVRAIVVSGEGKAFCAGGDLEWMRRAADYSEEQNYEDAMRLGRLFETVAGSRACVIAQVHGAAFGGGAGLVASCDVAVAQTGTLFAFSEARLGLIPATISPFVIPKIGQGNARWLFSTAEAFDATVAQRIGLVHDVASEGSLHEAVETRVAAVLGNGPAAVASSKRLALAGPVPMSDAARLLAQARSSDEGKEGVAAFLEKRPAKFKAETGGKVPE